MIPVITKELKQSVVSYLTNSCVGLLIYMPQLGLSRNPTGEEFERRRNLTMEEAASHEIGGLNLHGYQRSAATLNIQTTDSYTRVVYTVEFQAYEGSMDPFTHVCICRGVPIINDPVTGNGRGSSTGQVIAVMPVVDRPNSSEIGLILQAPEIYKASIPLNFTNYIV